MPRDTTSLPEAPAISEEARIMDGVIEILAVPEHWHKGQLCNCDQSAVCWRGAINKVLTDDPQGALWGHPLARRLVATAKTVAEALGYPSDVALNDDPYTTHADIMAFAHKVRAAFP